MEQIANLIYIIWMETERRLDESRRISSFYKDKYEGLKHTLNRYLWIVAGMPDLKEESVKNILICDFPLTFINIRLTSKYLESN